MTAEATAAAPARTTARPVWPWEWRLAGWVLLAGWAALLVTAVVAGERPSSFSRLEGAVAAGDVHVVRVTEGLGPSGRGYAVVDAHWRDGWFGDFTRVIEARPVEKGRRHHSGTDGVTAVVSGDVGARLRTSQPDLVVEQVDHPATETTYLGWRLPDWVGAAVPALFLATLFLLIAGPQPWRATRWAWFWLVAMAAPVGVPAYLLLAGPTSHLLPPRNPAKRLTGGWAFGLALVLGAVLGSNG